MGSSKTFISKIKKESTTKDKVELTVLIPAAGLNNRIPSKDPKCLLEVKNKSLLGRQIDFYKEFFPTAEIIVVVGHEADKIISKFRGICRFVKNESYDYTNVCKSIYLGLLATTHQHVIISYGDVIFDKHILKEIELDGKSKLVVSSGKTDEVGINVSDEGGLHLEYSFPLKWGHIGYFSGKFLKKLTEYVENPDHITHYTFEALNWMIDSCGPIGIIKTDRQIMDIDTVKDLDKAKGVF